MLVARYSFEARNNRDSVLIATLVRIDQAFSFVGAENEMMTTLDHKYWLLGRTILKKIVIVAMSESHPREMLATTPRLHLAEVGNAADFEPSSDCLRAMSSNGARPNKRAVWL